MSTLNTCISDFITYERKRGVFHKGREGILRDMVAFMRRNKKTRINTAIAKKYLDLHWNSAPSTKRSKLSIIRGFARFRMLEDPDTEIPSSMILPIERKHFSPHIFTAENLEMVMEETNKVYGKLGFAHLSQWTVVGLLIVSGLRSGEACRLSIRDVDLKKGLLRVRNGKGNRERIVAIHPTTVGILTSYLRQRRKGVRWTMDDPFFISMRGTPLRPGEIYRRFQLSLSRLNIVNQAGKIPRIHDLRHTFATDAVTRIHQMPGDPNARLPILSDALGHEHMRDTYRYTSFAPKVQTIARAKMNKKFDEEP
jgi:integrase